jgi:hypothetical protein
MSKSHFQVKKRMRQTITKYASKLELMMNSLQEQANEQVENQDIFDALHEQPTLPGITETDAVFLMHLDVPDKIREKLRAR